ncbi:MAG: hypothetical protein IBX71_02225 [Candidatus Desulforudis sp.]|nr:hypothetical protein [Desulforudis sp.]
MMVDLITKFKEQVGTEGLKVAGLIVGLLLALAGLLLFLLGLLLGLISLVIFGILLLIVGLLIAFR